MVTGKRLLCVYYLTQLIIVHAVSKQEEILNPPNPPPPPPPISPFWNTRMEEWLDEWLDVKLQKPVLHTDFPTLT